ncbi:MAG: hypothetical protein L0Y79_13070 [Chlorobi bacterium]|nr:hypothetical protein [Chlorobiota bacterium]MCI0715707.1 hypothetical protein [Chlorobiota bacterium]
MKIKELVSSISTDPSIFNHFFNAFNDKDNDSSAHIFYLILLNNPELNVATNVSNSANGLSKYNEILANPEKFNDITSKVAELFIKYNNCELIFEINNRKNTKEFIKLIFLILVENTNIFKFISEECIIENELFIYDSLTTSINDDERYNTFIKIYVSSTEIVEKLMLREFDCKFSSLYLAVYKVMNLPDSEFSKFIISKLKELKKEDWVKEIESLDKYRNTFYLIIEMVNKKSILGLDREFYEVLIEHYQKLKTGGAVNIYISENWVILLNALDKNNRATFISNVIDDIIGIDGNADKIIDLFGEALFECDLIKDNSDRLMRISFERFLDNKNEREIKWMNDILSKCPQIISNCKSYTIKTFEGKIKSELSDEGTPDNIKPLIAHTASLMGIEFKESETKKDGE